MKRTLLAMAVGAALLPLVAQAAPEFYGRLNVSLSNTSVQADDSGSTANAFQLDTVDGTTNTQSSVDVNSIQNWVGIRGEIPLYDQNLKAIYQVERGIDITNGNGNMSARNTFVGLAGDNWGKVFFGNYDSVVKKAEGKVDQFNHTEADMALYIGGQNRYSNTINYQSANYSGLTFNVQIIPGEGSKQDMTSSTPESEHGLADGYGASISFKQDTFWANLAYEKSTEDSSTAFAYYIADGAPVAAGEDHGVSTLRLTAGIDIGNISLALLAQQRDSDDVAGIKIDKKNDYVVSGAFGVTERLKLKAQIAQAEGLYLLNKDDDDRKIQSYTVGADYALGKNVTTYALYSANSIDGKFFGNKDKSEYNVASVGLTLKF
jgi:predicted porin